MSSVHDSSQGFNPPSYPPPPPPISNKNLANNDVVPVTDTDTSSSSLSLSTSTGSMSSHSITHISSTDTASSTVTAPPTSPSTPKTKTQKAASAVGKAWGSIKHNLGKLSSEQKNDLKECFDKIETIYTDESFFTANLKNAFKNKIKNDSIGNFMSTIGKLVFLGGIVLGTLTLIASLAIGGAGVMLFPPLMVPLIAMGCIVGVIAGGTMIGIAIPVGIGLHTRKDDASEQIAKTLSWLKQLDPTEDEGKFKNVLTGQDVTFEKFAREMDNIHGEIYNESTYSTFHSTWHALKTKKKFEGLLADLRINTPGQKVKEQQLQDEITKADQILKDGANWTKHAELLMDLIDMNQVDFDAKNLPFISNASSVETSTASRTSISNVDDDDLGGEAPETFIQDEDQPQTYRGAQQHARIDDESDDDIIVNVQPKTSTSSTASMTLPQYYKDHFNTDLPVGKFRNTETKKDITFNEFKMAAAEIETDETKLHETWQAMHDLISVEKEIARKGSPTSQDVDAKTQHRTILSNNLILAQLLRNKIGEHELKIKVI